MTEFLLIRHASAGHVGRVLAGRSPGIHLDDGGRAQAAALAGSLSGTALAAVFTSPLERCRETASPIAAAHGVEPIALDAFTEVDFGEWTGLHFSELEGREDWRWWNEARGTARPPGGESMAEVVARSLNGLADIAAEHDGGRVAVVSHCDVIRPLLAHLLGFPLDNILRLEVSPASVSVVELSPWGARVTTVNRTG